VCWDDNDDDDSPWVADPCDIRLSVLILDFRFASVFTPHHGHYPITAWPLSRFAQLQLVGWTCRKAAKTADRTRAGLAKVVHGPQMLRAAHGPHDICIHLPPYPHILTLASLFSFSFHIPHQLQLIPCTWLHDSEGCSKGFNIHIWEKLCKCRLTIYENLSKANLYLIVKENHLIKYIYKCKSSFKQVNSY